VQRARIASAATSAKVPAPCRPWPSLPRDHARRYPVGVILAGVADLLQHAPEAALAYYPVTTAVGSPRNKGPEVVEAVEL
jgi:hypothetical protein